MSEITKVVKHMAMDMGTTSAAAAAATTSAAAMSMGSMGSMGSMSMGSMSSNSSDMTMTGMNMYLTTDFMNYPVIFKGLQANTKAKAFGIFMLLFFIAFLLRGIEFLRLYLEQKVWKNPTYLGACAPLHTNELRASFNRSVDIDPKAASCCAPTKTNDVDSDVKLAESSIEPDQAMAHNPHKLRLASSLFRDFIRLILCILPDMFSFALMLAAMTFCVTYFFGVVIGLGFGRFFFEKLSDHHNLRAVTSGMGSTHCT